MRSTPHPFTRCSRHLRFPLLLVTLAGLPACGGGSGSAGNPGSGGGPGSGGTPTYVTGIAAAGAPLAAATVTLKDSAGHSATATTGSDGSFQVDVTTLTPPFLLSVPSGTSSSATLYSFASGSGTTANLNPYTTVVLQSYYTALGSSASSTFNGTLSASSFPNSTQLGFLVNPIVTVLQPYLGAASVSSLATFDPFTAKFTANHTGFDRVLDRTTLDSSLLKFTVDNGSGGTAGALSSTITVTAGSGSSGSLAQVSVATKTTDSSANVTSSSATAVPVGTATQQSDLASAQTGVLTSFKNLLALAQSKGSSLSTSDVLPYIDNSYLDRGQNSSALAKQAVSFLTSIPSGATASATVYRVNSFKDASSTDQLLQATIEITVTQSGGATTTTYLASGNDPSNGQVFRLESDGTWKFYGNQTQTAAQVLLQQSRFYDANSTTPNTPSNSLQMQTQVNVATGTLSAASVSGPANSLPDCTQTPSPLTQSSVTLAKDAGTFQNGTQDRFDLPCAAVDAGALKGVPPASGTQYTFALTSASGGGTLNQTYNLNGATNDNGDLTQINGQSRSTFASSNPVSVLAGTTLTLAYTPPTTYPVLYSYITAFCRNATELAGNSGGTDLQGALDAIPAGTNTGTIKIPTTCDGGAVADIQLDVWFIGVNRETSLVVQRLRTQ